MPFPSGSTQRGVEAAIVSGVARRGRDLPRDNCSNSPGSGCGGVSQTARPEPAGGGLASRCHQATHWMLSAPGRGMGGPTELCVQPWPHLQTTKTRGSPASGPPGPSPGQAAKSYRDRPGCHSKATHTSRHCSPHLLNTPFPSQTVRL